jgi:phosphohistidine phosphatase
MSLQLYLVRHAIAEELREGIGDADRRLTEEGIRKMQKAARGLHRMGVAPDRVVSSPLRRAVETAALVARALAPDVEVETEPSLAPGREPAEVVRWLASARAQTAIALVGHEPGIGRLASFLLTGSSEVVALRFKKGAVASFHLRDGRSQGAELEWFLTPRQLRALGGREA